MKKIDELNSFIKQKGLEFGEYILFQEYIQEKYDKEMEEHVYKITKPILGIYLGSFVADQTIGFNYVKWNNDKHTVYITNEYVTNHPACKTVDQVDTHVEWNDFIDVLGRWKNKPNWKQIIKAYRKQTL